MFSHAQVFGAFLFSALLASALAETAPPDRIIRGDPSTGSTVRPPLAWGGELPFDKRYDQLTAQEKETLNQFYENIGPGDEPPFPAHGLKPIYAAIAKVQQTVLVSGALFLIATVGPDGAVTQVKAMGPFDPEMTKVVATILTLTPFKPALCKGVPCTMDYPFRIHFGVRGR
jgi:hypothetical protein